MITISGSSSTSAVHVRGEIVKFLTVLVSNDMTSSGTSISSENNSILFTVRLRFEYQTLPLLKITYLEDESDDSSSSLDMGGRSRCRSLSSKSSVSHAVIEIEASLSERINVA